MSCIKNNILSINAKIGEAAERSGRSAEAVTLIGVTKTVGTEQMREMIECGVYNIGENRVQEIVAKYPHFEDGRLRWHMIGHLQKNKVRPVVERGCLIQSVDSLSLASEINRVSESLSKVTDILIEVNIAGEDTKYGIEPEKTLEIVKNLAQFNNIKVRGLMAMAPFIENQKKIRYCFKKMYEIFVDIREKNVNNVFIEVLSMGMTNDYLIAVEEGSSMVRVGTGIFGERL